MLASLQRLLLGCLLIVGAATLLLLSDLGSRTKPAATTPSTAPLSSAPSPTAPRPAGHVRVALLQQASQLVLDQGRAGMVAGLADRGWIAGENLDLKVYNAEGDMPVAQTIAKEMAGGGYDLLLSISTPSLQAVANANKAGKTPHVFALVTDPYGAGVGINRENHLDHPAHLAGYGTMQPVALAFKTARELNPALATVGVVWNAAEANSEAQVKLARQVCAELGITLLEATIDNSSAVAEAAHSLVARGVDALWMGGDVTVMTAVDSVIAAAKKGHIPAFTVIPPNVQRGALFDLGADYPEVGRLAGQLAGDVLNGRRPASVSVDNVMPEVLTLNLRALADLKPGWKIPASLRARAQLVIDESGTEHAQAAPPSAASSRTPLSQPSTLTSHLPSPPSPLPHLPSPTAAPGRLYRIAFAAYSPEPSLESCQKGLLEGLAALGFVEGKNLSVARTHAQGEMINIPQMLQNLDNTDADVLVTFTTPVLQNALTTAKHKPVVFTYVTDPLAAGAGSSFENHRPNVTGIGSLPPIDDTIRIIRRVLPSVKKLGTIYNSSEANSLKIISLLRESTQRAGLELVEITAASSNEVFQAAQALVARRVDAIYVPSDNTAYLAYDAIAKVATTAKLPLIIDDPDFLERDALFACGPGFYHSGRAAAPILARVLLGESPAGIPMANVSVNVTRFNRASIARLGLHLPESLLREIESEASAKPAPAASGPPLSQLSSLNSQLSSPDSQLSASPSANPSGKKWKIALVLYNETPPAEETLAGMKDAWARSSLVEGRDYEIKLRSAQGDIASMGGIIDAALTEGADIIAPMSTPALQAAVQKVKRTPIVFSLVANPMAAGAGQSYTDHLPNVTGTAVIAPFNEALDLLQKHFPAYRRFGTLFCPAEANSVDLKQSLEAACRQRGLTLETVAANSASELPDAALALAARPIDAILQLSDNLTSGGFTAITRAARQAKKPLISLNSTTLKLGAAISFGRDYHNGGETTVGLFERVIRGESPATMPFILPPKIIFAASEENARLVGLTLPPALLAEAAARAKPAPASATPSAASQTPLSQPSSLNSQLPSAPSPTKKKWNIAVVLYNETPPAEEILAGMKTAWARSRLVAGRDYEIKLRSAQGDIASLGGIFDAALTDRADLVVTLSTPTLQGAVKKIKRVPVVFTLVTNPMAAGAGKSYTDHISNVTGIAVLAPVAEALDMLQKHFPACKRLGTLYCPAEANAVYLKDALEELCRARGLTLETVAVNSSSELSDAALSLVTRPIDAILQIPDALSSAGFTAITRAARQKQMPLFALTSSVIPLGAAVALGRDFHDAGEATVGLIERVIAGEDPAKIPFALPPKVTFGASVKNAAAVGLILPPALLKEVDQIVE